MKKTNSAVMLALGAFSIALIIAVVYLFVWYSTANDEIIVEILPDNCYEETITVVADIDYEPFSFFAEEGKPSGYDIELMNAIANRMHVNIEVRLMSWPDCNAALINGEADIITGLDYQRTGYPGVILSEAVNNDSYVCFGKNGFENPFDLYDKKIAALEQSSSITDFLEPYRLLGRTTLYHTYSEVLQSVISGENDYAIARYSVGRRILAKLNESEVRAVGPMLTSNIVCLGINDKKPHLSVLADNAILELIQDGTIETLSHKWLGAYVELIGFNDFMRIYSKEIFVIAEVLVVLFAFVGFVIYRGRMKIIQTGQEKQIKEKELELTESRIAIMLSQWSYNLRYSYDLY